MTDWKSLAAARCPDIPADAVVSLIPSLEELESVFRPLAETLTADVELAVTFVPKSRSGDGR
jgi:hypothetical protein